MTTVRTQKGYGWNRDLPDFRDNFHLARPRLTAPRPKSFSMRAKMPPVYDQGDIGSCTANASCAAVEYNMMVQGLPFFGPSRLFAYWNARAIEGSTGSDSGATVRDAVKALVSQGVCVETPDWPYDESKFAVQPPPKCYSDARPNVVTSYNSLGGDAGPSVDELCDQLAGGEPVVFGMTVYESFEGDAIAKTGIMTMPLASEAVVGGHCWPPSATWRARCGGAAPGAHTGGTGPPRRRTEKGGDRRSPPFVNQAARFERSLAVNDLRHAFQVVDERQRFFTQLRSGAGFHRVRTLRRG